MARTIVNLGNMLAENSGFKSPPAQFEILSPKF